jgi:2-polyprenyl-3-methyl-5-hydroxy-6-metoxy-1,4-benzoquinol methylase
VNNNDPAQHEWGGMTLHSWENDPKRLAFQFARYKFSAKMFSGMERVLEVGCSDGFGSRIVRQHVASLDAVDWDERSIEEAKRNASKTWPVNFSVHDILSGPLTGYNWVYLLDVFEHISEEDVLLMNLRLCAPVCLIGIPSLESQKYASQGSLDRHVNCKSGEDLRQTCRKYWKNVFMFCMNDEHIHCGDFRMAHYLFALCV